MLADKRGRSAGGQSGGADTEPLDELTPVVASDGSVMVAMSHPAILSWSGLGQSAMN
jgi:hypothetical protein